MTAWSDGADRGISATRALGTILTGGREPTGAAERTPAQMRVYLLAADETSMGEMDDSGAATDASYEAACRWTGRLLLEAFEADPSLLEYGELDYAWDDDPDRGANGMKPE